MFLLGIGLGRSRGLILKHIFRGITALILTSAVAHASDGDDLLKAAFAGDLSQLRTLLEQDIDVNHQFKNGWTALILASQIGHEEIVQSLLARGANVELRTNRGANALSAARTLQIKQLLRAAGAKQ